MAADAVIDQPSAVARPYAPSWVNAITGWLERLPGPTWLAYVAVAAVTVVLTASGMLTDRGFAIANVYYGVLPLGVIGLIHGLDRAAAAALATIRPLLGMDGVELADVRYRLTVVPARPAAVIAVVAFVITPISYSLDPVGSGIVGYTPVTLVTRTLSEGFITALFLVLIYHTIRQLRLIARLHERVTRVDVFDQAPLYAMSRVTSTTAIGMLVLLAPSVFLIPAGADIPYLAITAAWYLGAVAIAASAFFLPLRGMHERLAAEKRRLQGEVGRRLTTTLDAIHAAVDAADGPAIESRSHALATLIAERDLVNRVSTWPWSGSTLTGFVSAVLLPIGLWAVTRVLERVV